MSKEGIDPYVIKRGFSAADQPTSWSLRPSPTVRFCMESFNSRLDPKL